MKRRNFIVALGSAAVMPLAARAQQGPMPVIGILHSQTPESESSRMVPILQGLREAGFEPSRNLTIEHRYAEGRNDRLPALATELVQRQVNVIFANTTPPANAAKAATAAIPIVFVTGVDPVKVGFVASLNRPGGNITGVTFLSNTLVAKRLELLSDVAPPATPIGMLAAHANPNTDTDVNDSMAAARNYAGRILKGERPANLPVMQSTKFELVINLKTAKALGIAMPARIACARDQRDRVVN